MNESIEHDVSHLNAEHLDLKRLNKILALACNPSDIIEIQDHIKKKLEEENQQLRDEVVRLLKAIRKKMLRATKCHDLKPLTKLNVQQSKRL